MVDNEACGTRSQYRACATRETERLRTGISNIASNYAVKYPSIVFPRWSVQETQAQLAAGPRRQQPQTQQSKHMSIINESIMKSPEHTNNMLAIFPSEDVW